MIPFIFACNKKKNNGDPAEPQSTLIEHALQIESIMEGQNPTLSQTRKGFLDIYNGKVYNIAEANAISSQIDFAYNYRGGGCSNCRFFENVKSMSTRTGYVASFSTITNTLIKNVAANDSVSIAEFDAIKTAEDISSLFNKIQQTNFNGFCDITNRTNDISIGNVFAFIDKNGKKGFFKIGDYTANVPLGDPATLNMAIKIQK